MELKFNVMCIVACSDPNARGSFSFVKEDPVLTYTLQYVSKYACPTNRQPSGTPPSITPKNLRFLFIRLILLVVVSGWLVL
jgi:hypothetical protein